MYSLKDLFMGIYDITQGKRVDRKIEGGLWPSLKTFQHFKVGQRSLRETSETVMSPPKSKEGSIQERRSGQLFQFLLKIKSRISHPGGYGRHWKYLWL